MTKQVQEAYIVAATRTPIGKAPRGMFRHMRPDDLLVHSLKSAMAQVPGLDPRLVEDVIVGCAFPEAEQGGGGARGAARRAGGPGAGGGGAGGRGGAAGSAAGARAAD